MLNNIKNLNILFENIKDGDGLGFWKNGLFAEIIQFFQKSQKLQEDLNQISHVGIVYNVKKQCAWSTPCEKIEILTFDLGEQTFSHGGILSKWQIHKHTKENGSYEIKIITNSRHKKLYWKQYDQSLTKEQIAKGLKDQEKQVGKRYGVARLGYSIPYISEKLGNIFQCAKSIKFYGSSRVCSGNYWYNMMAVDRITINEFMQNPQPTPEFVISYNKGKCKGKVHVIENLRSFM